MRLTQLLSIPAQAALSRSHFTSPAVRMPSYR
jgi:hypothetical protein